MALVQSSRFLLMALLLCSAAISVSGDENDDDFSDPALSEDPVATEAHPDIEPAWIFPDSPDGKVPVGGSTDLVVALANTESKSFNVSHIEGKLMTVSGKLVKELQRAEYGQPLGAAEQRSFRYPLPIDAEMPLGEYTFVAQAYYNTKGNKQPYVSVVYNDTIELVPPLPDKEAQMMLMLQLGVGGGVLALLALTLSKLLSGGSSSAGKPSKKAAGKEGGATKAKGAPEVSEWIKNIPAVRGAEDKPRKSKKA